MTRRLLLLFLAACTFASAASAQALPQPPEIAARSYLLVDMASQQVLAERNADAPADPASLTKLMTAYVVFVALRDKKLTLEQTLPVSERAWAERKGGGSLMFIDTKMTPTVDDLLKGMIVQSGNDASVVLAEGVAGSVDQFVVMMNRQAQAWGLKNTTFKNVTGLTEPGHRSTARELAVIAQHIITDFPDRYPYYSIREFRYNNIRQDNRNLLLRRDASVDGMKTGYTDAAGYCLIASAQREMPNGKRRLLSVVMGAASMQGRANESQKLLNWGYTAWDAVRLFDVGQAVQTVPVWKGKTAEARLVGERGAVYVSVPKGEGEQLKTRIERTDPLVAPLAQGQRVGTLTVTNAGGTTIATVPLAVAEAVPEAGILGRAVDSLRLWMK
ncbi:MAG: D-alanyl-D-alanine carboxypeptidase [Proteobacteria bacterium]|nr:D-alanyl-D-alanine carboxypeptidase [Pseudomonadota bacterium]